MDDYDLIVIGGGIGGSALAATMAAAGASVLVLERTRAFEDKVRGEWLAPWGVAETQRLGLYDVLMGAGAHHVTRHVSYDESRDAASARASAAPLGGYVQDVPGPLCIGHPDHCQALFDEAGRRGATMLRDLEVGAVFTGDDPRVIFTHHGVAREVRARLIVGADGRNSIVRDACGIQLHADTPHHMFGGLLVDQVEGWDHDEQAEGAEDGFSFLAFPQSEDRVRVFGSFSLQERFRFTGPTGPRRFLDCFRMASSPEAARIADGRPAGPLLAYINSDTWTDGVVADGAVLLGDAAGWTDPLIAVGMSTTYRDVRIITDLLRNRPDWTPALFASYAEERSERMRRLRSVARLTATLRAEFGDKAKARRRQFFERAPGEPALGHRRHAVMAGPEAAPPETFTAEYRAFVLGNALEDA